VNLICSQKIPWRPDAAEVTQSTLVWKGLTDVNEPLECLLGLPVSFRRPRLVHELFRHLALMASIFCLGIGLGIQKHLHLMLSASQGRLLFFSL
jgi:hypothetical protein